LPFVLVEMPHHLKKMPPQHRSVRGAVAEVLKIIEEQAIPV